MSSRTVLASLLFFCAGLATASAQRQGQNWNGFSRPGHPHGPKFGEVHLLSPNHGQTYAYYTILDKRLVWDAHKQRLGASITFSAQDYDAPPAPASNDTFNFWFPGVTLDQATGIFSVKAPNGVQVPVAHIRKDWIGKSIDPAKYCIIGIRSRSGLIHVSLEAQTIGYAEPRLHWVEDNHEGGWPLQNLLQ